MSAADCKRARKKMRNGYKHLPPLKRPRLVKRDPIAAATRQAEMTRRERERQQRKKP